MKRKIWCLAWWPSVKCIGWHKKIEIIKLVRLHKLITPTTVWWWWSLPSIKSFFTLYNISFSIIIRKIERERERDRERDRKLNSKEEEGEESVGLKGIFIKNNSKLSYDNKKLHDIINNYCQIYDFYWLKVY